MSSAICFNLDQSKNLSSGNGLIFENDNIRKSHIQNKPQLPYRKHCGKKRNSGYQHFLLFPPILSKTIFPLVVKKCDCLFVNGLQNSQLTVCWSLSQVNSIIEPLINFLRSFKTRGLSKDNLLSLHDLDHWRKIEKDQQLSFLEIVL